MQMGYLARIWDERRNQYRVMMIVRLSDKSIIISIAMHIDRQLTFDSEDCSRQQDAYRININN